MHNDRKHSECFLFFFQTGNVIGNILFKILSLVPDALIENYVKI